MARATEYDRRFYDAIREGCQRSAAAAAPVILDAVGPVGSLVDVGCGEGWWAAEFASRGVDVLGVDSGEVREPAPIPRESRDLREPLDLGRRFDVALTLEVAEHLPPKRAEGFVADLCDLADLVVFSAAMPRQGGTGHVNCQPPGYWADLFAAHGYGCSGGLRWLLWHDLDVEPWYRANLLLFSKHPVGPLFDGAHNQPLHVIPADLWLSRS